MEPSGSEVDIISGRVDEVREGRVLGWAENTKDNQNSVELEFIIDKFVVGSTVADAFREDLLAAGIRDGKASFIFEIPYFFYDGVEHSLIVRDILTKQVLSSRVDRFHLDERNFPSLENKRDWIYNSIITNICYEREDLDSAIKSTRKLAIYTTYHDHDRFLSFHRRTIEALSLAGFTVLVVHASRTFSPRLAEIQNRQVFLMGKKNLGYDFGSWCVGFFGTSNLLHKIDEIIFVNDSVFGPMFDLPELMERIRALKVDFAGLTDSYEHHHHIQSYFFWFGTNVIRSIAFARFFGEYPFPPDKKSVIGQGELSLTKVLFSAGFDYSVCFPYETLVDKWFQQLPRVRREIRQLEGYTKLQIGRGPAHTLMESLDRIVGVLCSGQPVNPTHFFWDVLIKDYKFPFIKREFLFHNPAQVPTYYRCKEVVMNCNRNVWDDILGAHRVYGGSKLPLYHSRSEPRVRSGTKKSSPN